MGIYYSLVSMLDALPVYFNQFNPLTLPIKREILSQWAISRKCVTISFSSYPCFYLESWISGITGVFGFGRLTVTSFASGNILEQRSYNVPNSDKHFHPFTEPQAHSTERLFSVRRDFLKTDCPRLRPRAPATPPEQVGTASFSHRQK